MAKLWSDVEQDPAYQSLSDDDKEAARNQYFEEVVAPQVDTPDLELARAQFDEDTKPTKLKKLGESLKSVGKALGKGSGATAEALGANIEASGRATLSEQPLTEEDVQSARRDAAAHGLKLSRAPVGGRGFRPRSTVQPAPEPTEAEIRAEMERGSLAQTIAERGVRNKIAEQQDYLRLTGQINDPMARAAAKHVQIPVGKAMQDVGRSAVTSKLYSDPYHDSTPIEQRLKDRPVETLFVEGAKQSPNFVVSLAGGAFGARLGVTPYATAGGTSFVLEKGDIFQEGKEFLAQKYNGEDSIPDVEWAKLNQLANEHGAFNAALDALTPGSQVARAMVGKALVRRLLSKEGVKYVGKEWAKDLTKEIPTELAQEESTMRALESTGKTFTPEEKMQRRLAVVAGTVLPVTAGSALSSVSAIQRTAAEPETAAAGMDQAAAVPGTEGAIPAAEVLGQTPTEADVPTIPTDSQAIPTVSQPAPAGPLSRAADIAARGLSPLGGRSSGAQALPITPEDVGTVQGTPLLGKGASGAETLQPTYGQKLAEVGIRMYEKPPREAAKAAPPAEKPVKTTTPAEITPKRKPTLRDAVVRLGGISTDERMDITGDTKGNYNIPGVGHLFTPKGTSLDGMAEKLVGEGWFSEEDRQSGDATRKLAEMLKDEVSGVKQHYHPDDITAKMQKEFEQYYADQEEAERPDFEEDPFFNPPPAHLELSGYNNADAPTKDLIALYAVGRQKMGSDAFDDMLERLAERNPDADDNAFEKLVRQEIERHGTEAKAQAAAARSEGRGDLKAAASVGGQRQEKAAAPPVTHTTPQEPAPEAGTATPAKAGVSVSVPEIATETDYGKKNKVFTEDAAAKARERLKKKLNQLNAGLDPELMKDAITLAGYHVESGARKFADFSKAMIEDIGEAIRPYLKALYLSVRNWPGFDNAGMETEAQIEATTSKAPKVAPEAKTSTPAVPGQTSDMFGGKSDTAQAIKDREIERQKKIDEAPPMEAGPGDLFSDRSKQADLLATMAEATKSMAEAANALTETVKSIKENANAQQDTEASPPDANVRQPPRPEERQGEMPAAEGRQGVREGGQEASATVDNDAHEASTSQTPSVEERIADAESSGIVLSDSDKDAIRHHAAEATRIREQADRIIRRGSDPMGKGHAFPMGVGYTKMTKRKEQAIDRSVRMAGEASKLYEQAIRHEKLVETMLSGKGTEADKAAKAHANESGNSKIVEALVNWKPGVKFGKYDVVRVNKDRDGYPASFTISGEGIVKGVMDKVDVVKELFGGDKDRFRGLVDEIRQKAEMPAAPITESQTPTRKQFKQSLADLASRYGMVPGKDAGTYFVKFGKESVGTMAATVSIRYLNDPYQPADKQNGAEIVTQFTHIDRDSSRKAMAAPPRERVQYGSIESIEAVLKDQIEKAADGRAQKQTKKEETPSGDGEPVALQDKKLTPKSAGKSEAAADGNSAVKAAGAELKTKETDKGVAMFSRRPRAITGDDTLVSAALSILAGNDEMFRLPTSDAKTMAGIADDVDPGIKVTEHGRNGARTFNVNATRAWTLNFPEREGRIQSASAIELPSGEIYLNISDFREGGAGNRIYHIVANYAYNNGMVFIGDPYGLSDAAMYRRTENMLSSALKFGTTAHLVPHERQLEGDADLGIPPLDWRPGEDAHNINALAEVSYAAIVRRVPELANVRYNFETRRFEDAHGNEVSDQRFVEFASSRGARSARAGRDTLKRTALINTLLQTGRGAERGRVLGELLRQRREHLDPSLQRIFYSRTEGRPQGGLSVSGITLRDLEAMVARVTQGYRNLPPIITLESPDQAPEALRSKIKQAGAMGDVEGAFHDGKVYLFADNLRSEERAEHVLMEHEIGHYGLRGVFGKGLDPILSHIYLSNENIRKAANARRTAHGLKSTVAAVEEVLVDMPMAEMPKLKGWGRLVSFLRDWFLAHGFQKLADRLNAVLVRKYGEQGVADLFAAEVISRAREWARSGRPTAATQLYMGGATRFSLEQSVFYSALVRAIEESKQTKAPATQWKLWLKNQTGIKQEEIDWLGVNEWLDEQKGAVAKDALLNFVMANQVANGTDVDVVQAKTAEVPGLDITPAMRDSAMQGQPLFEPKSEYTIQDDLFAKDATEEQKQLAREAIADLNRFAPGRQDSGRGALLGSSIPAEFAEKGKIDLVGQKAETPEDLAVLAQVYRDPRFETFRIFFLKGNSIVGQTGVSSRLPGVTGTFVGKTIEDQKLYNAMIRAAMKKHGADGYYLLHNHPSGIPEPSPADLAATHGIVKALDGYQFHGHVIINENKYGVIDVKGIPRVFVRPLVSDYSLRRSKPVKPHPILGQELNSPQALARLAKEVQVRQGYIVLIGKNRDGVRGIMEIPQSVLSSRLRALAIVRKFSRDTGSVHVFAAGIPDAEIELARQAIKYGVLKDAIYESGRRAGLDEITLDKAFMGRVGAPGMHAEEGDIAYGEEPEENRLLRPARKATMEQDASILDHLLGGKFLFKAVGKLGEKAGVTNLLHRSYDAILQKSGEILPESVKGAVEKVKAGIVSNYGLDEAYQERKADMQAAEAAQARKSHRMIEMLANLSRAEARVAYYWMQEKPDTATERELMARLPEASRQTLKDLKQLISDLGREAVRLKQLTDDSFQRNNMAYLHRSYAKHVLADEGVIRRMLRSRALRIKGDQYKGRGIFEEVDMERLQNIAPDFWRRKLQQGQADTSLKGEKFIRFEKRDASGEVMEPLPGMTAKPLGKLRGVAYWPASEPVPARFGDWVNAGTWEVRGTKRDKLIMWRDLTKAERQRLGELDEVRYAVAQTLQMMVHDIEMGRFFEWVGGQYARKEAEGKVVEAKEGLRHAFGKGTWVRVPDTEIPGTKVKKYGALSGMYVPGPIWSDMRQIASARYEPWGRTYANVLRFWKRSKALALDTPIPTPSGWTTMGDIKVGDKVFDESGQVCEVLHATPVQFNRQCYEVRFSDDTKIIADAEHFWFTIYHRKAGVRTTEEIKATLKERTRGDANHSIPVAKALDLPDATLPIQPYALGVWLGDGDTNAARISCGGDDVNEMIRHLNAAGVRCGEPSKDKRNNVYTFQLLRPVGCCRNHEPSNITPKGCRVCANEAERAKRRGAESSPIINPKLQTKMRRIGLLGRKHIPVAYLRASELQRRELLMGLMDSDGHIQNPDGFRRRTSSMCQFTTTIPELRDGILELLRSLGYKPSVCDLQPICNGKRGKPAWRISFKAYSDKPVFRLERKKARLQKPSATRQRSQTRQIVSVTPVASVPVRCIAVSSKSKLYLAGDGMVPTHNTAWTPGVHMNNVMANFIMADWHDIRSVDLYDALKVWINRNEDGYKQLFERFQDSGALGGMFVANDLMRNEINERLKELKADLTGEVAGMEAGNMAKVLQLVSLAIKPVKATGEAMTKAYQAEDEFFRLAVFLKAIRYGHSDRKAGSMARHAFLNYDINAPWIQALRHTGLPFISFFYRAFPMLLQTVKNKPWKVTKLMAFWSLLSALGYAMTGDDDEERERKRMPEEKAGRVWGLVPKMIRMPWSNEGAPVFLDIRRWVPVGDIADLELGHGWVPPPLVPSGPLVTLAEVMPFINKSLFTQKEVYKDTDTFGEASVKVMDHLFKSIMPNVPVPNPIGWAVENETGQLQTYAWSGIEKAIERKENQIGEVRSIGQAALNTIGVKVGTYPANNMLAAIQAGLRRDMESIDQDIQRIGRDYNRLEHPSEADKERRDKAIARQIQKRREAVKEARERMGQ